MFLVAISTLRPAKTALLSQSYNVDIDKNGFRLNGWGVAGISVYSSVDQSRIHDGFTVAAKTGVCSCQL